MDEQLAEFYNSMSNFELSELSLMYVSALQDQLTLFVSILFAYLAMSFFAAEKLSKSEVIAISTVYVVFQFQVVATYFLISKNAAGVIQYISGEDTSYNTIWIVSVLVVVLLLSLVFMYRKRARNDT